MNPLNKIVRLAVFVIAFLAFMAGARQAVAQVAQETARTITAGPVAGITGTVGTTVTLPIAINDPTGIGGIAFTMTYNAAIFEFLGLEKATSSGWTINDGSAFQVPTAEILDGVTYYNPYVKTAPYADRTYTTTSNSTLFYQFNDVKGADLKSLGRVLIAGASATPLTGTTLFNAKFKITGGIPGTKYPINLLRSIIKNPQAGYNVDTFLPILMGTTQPDTSGKYTSLNFPVIPAELKGGSITVQGDTFNLSGLVTYEGGANAAGVTVVLRKESTGGATGVTGYFYNSETIAGTDGRYSFSGKPAGNYKLFIRSLNPQYNDFESTVAIAVSANKTDANAVLPLKPQPIYVTGTVTAGNIPGLLVKVVDGSDNVMGVYGVSPTDGKWSSSLLPPLTTGTYHWYLVYGSLTSAKDATTFDVSQLKSISGKISGLASGKEAGVTAGSVTGKLLKPTKVTQTGTGDVTYTIDNLVPASDYIVSVVVAGQPVTYYSGATDISAATKVDISSANATGIDFTFTTPENHIAGWIKESGNGVSGTTVYGFEVNTFALIQAATDGSGNFDLTVKPGTYEVFVIKSNGKIFYFYDTTGNGTPTQAESSAALVQVATGQSAANINIDITEADKTLSGKVTYRTATGDPAANVLIAAWTATQRALALTDQKGAYTISGLVNGVTYNVDMKPLSGNYPVQSTTIVGGTNTVLDFIIDTGSVLSGTVTEEGVTPVKNVVGAMIFLKDQTTGALVGGRVYFSDKDGKYSIRDISSGSYTLEVTHPDYQSYSTNLDLGAADVTQDVALTKGAYFKGTVTDGSSGNALPGVTIIAIGTDVTVYTVTNINGLYSIYGVDATKTYMIFAQKRGYERNFAPAKTPTTAGTTVNFTLSLPVTTYTVSGTVKTSDNAAVNGAYVFVHSKSKNFFASTQTGTDGTYSISGLVSSTDYGVVVVPPGNLPVQTATLSVSADTTKDFTINLGLNIGGTIAGPPNGTLVYVFLHKGTQYVTFVETTNGAFTFKGLEAGSDYKILAVAPGSGYTPSWYNGKTSIATADQIDITAGSQENIAITLTKP